MSKIDFLIILQVRLRPSSAEMEVDLAIDFDSKNFDRDSVHAATIKKQVLLELWKLDFYCFFSS